MLLVSLERGPRALRSTSQHPECSSAQSTKLTSAFTLLDLVKN